MLHGKRNGHARDSYQVVPAGVSNTRKCIHLRVHAQGPPASAMCIRRDPRRLEQVMLRDLELVL